MSATLGLVLKQTPFVGGVGRDLRIAYVFINEYYL